MLERGEQLETVMENVTLLEVTPDGIKISTLFEEPKILPKTSLKKIDFLDGVVTLVAE